MSIAVIRRCGVDELVDFRGSGLFRPQSPRDRDDFGVAMACRVGYGRVAESDERRTPMTLTPSIGAGGRGGGSENSRELRSSLPVGELTAFDMAAVGTEKATDFKDLS